jgi:hypothetical protein
MGEDMQVFLQTVTIADIQLARDSRRYKMCVSKVLGNVQLSIMRNVLSFAVDDTLIFSA